jgi:hypothetical protein
LVLGLQLDLYHLFLLEDLVGLFLLEDQLLNQVVLVDLFLLEDLLNRLVLVGPLNQLALGRLLDLFDHEDLLVHLEFYIYN